MRHHAFGTIGRHADQDHVAQSSATVQELHLLAFGDGQLTRSRGRKVRYHPRHFHAGVLQNENKFSERQAAAKRQQRNGIR